MHIKIRFIPFLKIPQKEILFFIEIEEKKSNCKKLKKDTTVST